MNFSSRAYIALTALVTSLLLTSCTDNISEEVKNSETLSEEQQTAAKFSNKSIRVVSTMPEGMSHILHKSGSMEGACEIKSPTLGFESTDYDKTSDVYTTDCILDVQEYDLFKQGAKLEVQVDEFLCEYINYKPFRFLQYLPGETTRTQYKVTCDTTCAEAQPDICDRTFHTGSGILAIDEGGVLTQGQMDPTDTNNALLKNSFNPVNTPLTCQFDYSSTTPRNGTTAPNCDEGSITTHTINIISGVDGAGDPICTSDVDDDQRAKLDTITTSTVSCGGLQGSCLGGPGADLLEPRHNASISDNTELGYFTKAIDIEAPYDKGHLSNKYIANFSRICSSTSNIKTNTLFDLTLNNIVGYEVEDMPLRAPYPSYPIDDNADGENDYIIKADHPFKGEAYYYSPSSNVKPYYAIECLDQALDIKAQIRVFIREWDRSFSASNPYIARLSDINQAVPLMDASGTQAPGQWWNDKGDWDDWFGDTIIYTNNQCSSLNYGFCSDSNYTDEETCRANLEDWRLSGGRCTDTSKSTPAECSAASGTWTNLDSTIGSCSDKISATKTACDSAGKIWTPTTYPGHLFPGGDL